MALPTNNQTIPRNNTTLPPTPPQSSGASPVARPTATPQPVSRAMPEPQGGHVTIRPLRTYKDDLAEAIKRSGSADSVRRAAQPQRSPVAKPLPPTPPPIVKQAPPLAPPKPVAPMPPPRPVTVPPQPVPTATIKPPEIPHPPVFSATPTVAQSTSPQSSNKGDKRVFFEQLLSHKRSAPQPTPSIPLPIEPAAPTPPPIVKQAPAPVPPKPVVPMPSADETPPHLPPLDSRVRFIEEHAVASHKLSGGGALPSWAMPGETAAQRNTAQQERTAQEVAIAEARKPKPYTGPIITHEAPTYGSAVIQPAQSQNTLRAVVMAIMGILILGGVGGSGYVWFKNHQTAMNQLEDLQSIPFIVATEAVTLDATALTDKALFDTYRSAEQVPLAGQTLHAIVPTIQEQGSGGVSAQRSLRAEEFLDRVAQSSPGIFTRSLADRFASGVYGSVSGNSGFLIFGLNDHDRALSGLLSWEPRMGTELAPLLLVDTIYPAVFSDAVIEGVAVRRAGIGEKALVYGIINKNILLITRGEGTFKMLRSLIQTP